MSNRGFLLLFRSGEWWQDLGREELEKYIAQSNAWLEQLMTSGQAKGGQALARQGAVITGQNVRSLTDGPFAETKEVIGGYLLLDVGTVEEAIAIAKTAPMLGQGTSIEVRPLTNDCPSQARQQQLLREESLAVA